MAAAVAAASVFSSCKKKENENPTPTPEKTCVINKTYDANGKLQAEYMYAGDKLNKINNYTDAGEIESTSTASYDASGKVSKVEESSGSGSTTTYTYEYNASGTLGKVTVKDAESEAVLSFEYNGTNPELPSRVRITADFMGTPLEVAYQDFTYDDRGNNTQAVSYVLDFQGGSGYKKQTTTTYEYDNKKNPNRALAAIMLLPSFSGPNNITKEHSVDHSGSSEDTIVTTSYEYNPENYPVKSTRTDSKGESTITTIEYSCK